MNVQIRIAKKNEVCDCLNCIKHSDLWATYFKSNKNAAKVVKDRIKRKQIYVAITKNGKCVGVMGILDQGCFGKFPYLSILGVKRKYRSRGMGKILLAKFEEISFENSNTIFLLVSDFNKNAKKLYKKNGYKKVGDIPNLFKNGVAESLLMKQKNITKHSRGTA